MKFNCLQENLSKALTIVGKAISNNPGLPILTNVLLKAEGSELTLSGTDLSTAITVKIGASIDEEGSITVPAKLFSEYVSGLSPTNIQCELEKNILHVTAGKSKFKFNGVDAADYPELPEVPTDAQHIELSPKDFQYCVNLVTFSSSSDSGRPILTGILLNYENEVLTFVGVDGFRLSEKTMPISQKAGPFSVVIPAKTLQEVARILSSSGDSIKMYINDDDNLVMFESDGALISTRILHGEYPDYKKIIPTEKILKCEFSAEALLEAVRLTHVMAKSTSDSNTVPSIKVLFNPTGKIKISSVSEESGAGDVEIDAFVEADAELEVSFNAKYILDFLTNIKAERFSLETNGGVNPALIRPISWDTEDYIHIVMPMRLH